jgi:hypothetical protein
VLLGSERFFADQLSRHRLYDSRIGAGRSKTFPPTRGAVLGDDFDKARGPLVGRVEALSEWLRELRLEDVSTDIVVAHGRPSATGGRPL